MATDPISALSSDPNLVAVRGEHTSDNYGVFGISDTNHGVHGTSRTNHAVHGESAAGRGVVGVSQTFVGVTGQSTTGDGTLGISETGVGIHGKGGKLAGLFEGDVSISGALSVNNVLFKSVVDQINILRDDISHLPTTTALQDKVNALQTQVNTLQSQSSTAINNLQARVTITEVEISDLKARVTALGG